MAIEIGRRGRTYVKKEAAYGETLAAFASTDAVRHINLGFDYQPFDRVISPEKSASPAVVTRFDRRVSAGLAPLEALLRPSGTLNTLPEADEVFEAAFGSKTNVTLATTVASGGTTTGATLTSAAGLAKNDAVVIVTGGIRYMRFLTSVAGAVVTWAPALPGAVVNGDSVKGCVTYKLTSNLAISLAIAHYLDTFKRALVGVGVNELELTFDATEEGRWSASGPAKEQFTGAGVPAVPGAFTVIGTQNPPGGIIGTCYINDTIIKKKTLSVTLTNNLVARNNEQGQSKASEVYRNDRRNIDIGLDTWADAAQEPVLYDLTEAGTPAALFEQLGTAEGNLVAIRCPKVDFRVPTMDDPDTEISWSFEGLALATADGENDELLLAFG
jgi:hypothetical protein